MKKNILLLFFALCLFTESAHSKQLTCDRTMQIGSVKIHFINPNGPQEFIFEKKQVDVAPILGFLAPYFNQYGKYEQQFLSLTTFQEEYSSGRIDGVARNTENKFVLHVSLGFPYIHEKIEIPLNEIKEISFPYDASGAFTKFLQNISP